MSLQLFPSRDGGLNTDWPWNLFQPLECGSRSVTFLSPGLKAPCILLLSWGIPASIIWITLGYFWRVQTLYRTKPDQLSCSSWGLPNVKAPSREQQSLLLNAQLTTATRASPTGISLALPRTEEPHSWSMAT